MHGLVSEIERYKQNKPDNESLLQHVVQRLHDEFPTWNWVGIYFLRDNTLELGPFVGKPTEHDRIEVGVGVCGSSVANNRNTIVADVTKLDNYLACTLETRSEIVVLIRHEGKVVAQFDVDSDLPNAFSTDDERLLERLAVLVAPACV